MGARITRGRGQEERSYPHALFVVGVVRFQMNYHVGHTFDLLADASRGFMSKLMRLGHVHVARHVNVQIDVNVIR